MSDQELLEAAAKRVGLGVKRILVDADDNFVALVVATKHSPEKIRWNPLKDDGDALRLAVQCGITITPKDASLVDIRRAIVNMAAYESNKHDSRNPRSPNKTC